MKTIEFFNRLLSPLTANSLESLNANEGLELVTALNAGLQHFYASAPDRYRRKDGESFSFRAPIEMEGDFEKGSASIKNVDYLKIGLSFYISITGVSVVSGVYLFSTSENGKARYENETISGTYAIWESGEWRLRDAANIYYISNEDVTSPIDVITWVAAPNVLTPLPSVARLSEVLGANLRGSSVLIENTWNRVKGENQLQHTYLGESGRKSFTLYGDAIPLDGVQVDRLLSHPKLEGGRHLSIMSDSYALDWMHLGERRFNSTHRSVGTPEYYKMVHVGDGANAVEQEGILFIAPLPTVAGHLTVDILHRPQRYTLKNLLRESVALPLADDLIERILLPIAIGTLIDSEQWRNDRAIDRAERRAYEARQLAGDLEPYIGIPNFEAGTAHGY